MDISHLIPGCIAAIIEIQCRGGSIIMPIVFVIIALVVVSAPTVVAAPNGTKTQIPYTTFQTGGGYQPEHDIKTDAVIVYADLADRIKGWADNGYYIQTMYGFRTGPDYIKDHADEVQTAKGGGLHTCGPGSYYMVPTESRIKAAVQYFTNAINNGAQAICPEEPEFFTFTGYSQSFKDAWQKYYNEPWQDQESSIEARWKSDRLKSEMQYKMVKSIVDAAAAQKSDVRRMVACHSAVTYAYWNIIYPHYQCMMLPNLQEIIGQVWTGTARSANRYEGKMQERTFETAFLEYSSLANLVRGTDKRMWFLMDPLEDNQDRSMEDYHSNYEKTLVACLLFPEVDSYEVLPWPNRIYGRIPGEFATQISSIINALQDMHNQTTAQYDMGTRGIATFVADSMAWQRGNPHGSNFDCFWGLTLPLIYKGIPIQVSQLERVVDKGYLSPYKVLLLNYEIMKPMNPQINQAIAEWVKEGGVLVVFGGEDAYNDLPEWWKERGFASPTQDLMSRLSVSKTGKGRVIRIKESPSVFASSAKDADRLREIVQDACKAASLAYRENPRLGIRRGDYVAIRVFDGEKKLSGWYVDLLNPRLPVAKNPVIPADKCALYKDVTKLMAGDPKLLYTSSRVENLTQQAGTIRMKLSGPQDTRGVVRLYAPPAALPLSVEVDGKTASGNAQAESEWVEQEGDTVLISFDNKPKSIELIIKWRN